MNNLINLIEVVVMLIDNDHIHSEYTWNRSQRPYLLYSCEIDKFKLIATITNGGNKFLCTITHSSSVVATLCGTRSERGASFQFDNNNINQSEILNSELSEEFIVLCKLVYC